MLKSIFTNSSGILFSRILGFFRDMLTASILGVNIYSDIFFVAFQLPNLFRRIFGEGAFSQAFLPSFTRTKHKILFSASVFYKLIFAILLLTLLVNIFSFEITKIISAGFSDEVIQKAEIFVKINFFYLTLIFIVTFLSALLHFKEHFVTTAFSTALLNISMISALLLSQNLPPKDIVFYLSYGVVIGGLLQVLAHLIALKFTGMQKVFYGGLGKFRRFHTVKKDSKHFFNKFFLAIWGGGTAQISSFLDTLFASFLMTGSISYLYFANRVFQFPLALFAIATTIAIFPRVSKFIKQKKYLEAEKIFKFSFWLLFSLLSSATIIGIVFADEIVSLLFERGNFGESDRIATAQVLIFYLLGLSVFGISKLFSLWLYAHEQIGTSAKISTYSLVVKIVFSAILISPFGVSGLALSTAISSLILFILTVKEFGFQRFKKIIFDKLAIFFLIWITVLNGVIYFKI